MFRPIAAVALIGTFAFAAQSASADVVSTFDSSAQGWGIVSFADLPSSNYSVVGTYSPTFFATGGNPGGFIGSQDPDGGDYTFSAPTAFLGNVSSATGLSYDISRPVDGVSYQTTDVMLLGTNGTRLLWESPTPIVPTAAWQNVNVLFQPSANWLVGTTSGALATAADFQGVLGGLSAIYIRGEYAFGADDTALDNITLAGVSPVPEASTTALLALGLAGLGAMASRRRKSGKTSA